MRCLFESWAGSRQAWKACRVIGRIAHERNSPDLLTSRDLVCTSLPLRLQHLQCVRFGAQRKYRAHDSDARDQWRVVWPSFVVLSPLLRRDFWSWVIDEALDSALHGITARTVLYWAWGAASTRHSFLSKSWMGTEHASWAVHTCAKPTTCSFACGSHYTCNDVSSFSRSVSSLDSCVWR